MGSPLGLNRRSYPLPLCGLRGLLRPSAFINVNDQSADCEDVWIKRRGPEEVAEDAEREVIAAEARILRVPALEFGSDWVHLWD